MNKAKAVEPPPCWYHVEAWFEMPRRVEVEREGQHYLWLQGGRRVGVGWGEHATYVKGYDDALKLLRRKKQSQIGALSDTVKIARAALKEFDESFPWIKPR